MGEENEEYSSEWSSDWRTWEPGEKGGAWNASAPPQGHHARFGPLASFPYRYLMSSMRSLQMRVNLLLASNTVVNDELFCYMALAVGRTAEDSPDAFAFLASTRFSYGRGRVSNLERWLHQRSEPSPEGHGVRSFPDARITQTPAPPSNGTWMTEGQNGAYHDYIAQTSPAGVFGFSLDPRFAHSVARPLGAAVVKVTIFDVVQGTVRLTQAHLQGAVDVVDVEEDSTGEGAREGSPGMRRRRWQAGSASGLMWAAPASSDEEEDGDDGSNERRMIPQLGDEVPTVGDGALKTLTFVAEALATRNADTQCAACSFDFEVRATNLDGNASVPLVVSLVRVIKIGGGAAGHVIGDADAASGGRGLPFVTKLAVALGVVVAVYALVFGANLLLRRKHIRFSVRSSINPNIASASPDLQAWPPQLHSGSEDSHCRSSQIHSAPVVAERL